MSKEAHVSPGEDWVTLVGIKNFRTPIPSFNHFLENVKTNTHAKTMNARPSMPAVCQAAQEKLVQCTEKNVYLSKKRVLVEPIMVAFGGSLGGDMDIGALPIPALAGYTMTGIGALYVELEGMIVAQKIDVLERQRIDAWTNMGTVITTNNVDIEI